MYLLYLLMPLQQDEIEKIIYINECKIRFSYYFLYRKLLNHQHQFTKTAFDANWSVCS